MSGRSAIVAVSVVAATAVAGAQSATSGRTTHGLAFERAGSGPAVVFIHGAFLDRRMWNREFEALRGGATVVRYDQRGHGQSAMPSERFSHVADLLTLLDELKIERATLIGLSSGAQIALDAALAAPARVERLVLAGPSISGYVNRERQPFVTDLMAALKAGDYRRAGEVILDTPVYAAPPESKALVRSMVLGNEALWKVDPSLIQPPEVPALKRLEEMKVPALVLVGDADAAAILEQADILGRRVPGARVVRVPGGGHLLNLTSPEEFMRLVIEFLRRE